MGVSAACGEVVRGDESGAARRPGEGEGICSDHRPLLRPEHGSPSEGATL